MPSSSIITAEIANERKTHFFTAVLLRHFDHETTRVLQGIYASIQNRKTRQIQIWSCESMRVGRISTRQTQIWSTREGAVGTDDSSNPDLVLEIPYLEMERQASYSLLQIWTWMVERVTRFSRSGHSESIRVSTTRAKLVS